MPPGNTDFPFKYVKIVFVLKQIYIRSKPNEAGLI